jgi:16S rRNA processing protein RimM
VPPRGRPKRVCVGAIGGAHGVRGLVRIKSFTETPGDLTAYGELTDEAGERRFSLTVTGRVKGAVLARIADVADRDAAAALKGTRLYVARDALPPPAADEYYYADLIGLAVELPDGTAVGRVRAVDDYGAGDVLEVALDRPRGGGPVVMVPFTRAAVPVVDPDAGRIVVNPLPGLLEPDAEPRDRGPAR